MDTAQVGGSYDQSSSCVSIEDFSDVSSSILLSSAMRVNDDQSLIAPVYAGHLPVIFPMEQGFMNLERNTMLDEQLTVDETEDVSDWLVSESSLPSEDQSLEGTEAGSSLLASPVSSEASTGLLPNQTSLVLPSDDMEVDDQLSILHLLKAYGEAMEMEAKELGEEIVKRLHEKACPMGSTLQRLAYYLIQALDKEVDFLVQEASRNFEAAFLAFYQIFPYGRFAHFTANSVILEAIPRDVEVVHIVDFDIGNGVQWPSVIEAIARRGHRGVRLTAIKWEEEDYVSAPATHRFEETKMRLQEYARSFGLRLKVEEMGMDALVSEMKRTKKNGGGSEWLAFNCMLGLPHMGKVRSISSVLEFLRIAKDSIRVNSGGGSVNRGIIIFGDGTGWDRGMRGLKSDGSNFEGHFVQFQAFLESIDHHFPHHLREARIAMECLFMIPHLSSLIDSTMWQDNRTLSDVGLEAWRMRKESLLEAKELVREGESMYWVNIEGVKANQMVLGYMGTPLVKVSCWR
ncbi:hypothetical protein Tsubulata_000456 [Turnera subulata]|uniref:Uncharacterized protein n=1 Tax=Turnera subulata TaxID=218843 RepID=A0A9Q0FZ04_9ROSI|nr:hypothetical protein Tsubulata_000456 [Turnera subulata]